MRRAVLAAGAYGATLSGAGPSMIALTLEKAATSVARATRESYESCGGVPAIARPSRPAGPAGLAAEAPLQAEIDSQDG